MHSGVRDLCEGTSAPPNKRARYYASLKGTVHFRDPNPPTPYCKMECDASAGPSSRQKEKGTRGQATSAAAKFKRANISNAGFVARASADVEDMMDFLFS